MPQPQLPTIKGRGLDYNVEQAIYRLQAAIGELNDRLASAGPNAALEAQVAALEAQVRDLKRQQDIAVAERITGTGEAGGGTPGGGTPGGGAPTVPFPSALAAESRNYADAHPAELLNSCIDMGGSNAYMVGLVAYLRGIDERVNFNGKRGDSGTPSQDAVSYYYGVLPAVEGSHDVYVIDVIACLCGPEIGASCGNPKSDWNNVSRFGPGAWISTPP